MLIKHIKEAEKDIAIVQDLLGIKLEKQHKVSEYKH